ncbi:MAG: lysophospholipase [Deltaproteobacteria bacterium]|nr:lysophospholipase [Deltaproteobacteria bacterium]
MPRKDEGFFSSKDSTRLYWHLALPDAPPTAFVAIVHGYADHTGRYLRTIDALVARGFGVMSFDYRGHGKADGKRGDVERFERFIDDLEAFWAKVRAEAGSTPTFVLAHSHGALIATHWALKRPEGLKGLIFSSPYYKLAFEPPAVKLFAARLIKGLLPALHLGNELKADQLSRDEAWQKETLADPLYFHVTTPRWFFEHTAAQAALASRGTDLTQPLFVVAGDSDPIASMPAARAFFETVASRDKTWKEYAGFRHEVLNEVGRESVWDDISQWISAHR